MHVYVIKAQRGGHDEYKHTANELRPCVEERN